MATEHRLPLSRDERLAALRRIDPDRVEIGRRQWRTVVDLLTQVELCSLRDGCHAYVETLAARMAGGVGVSRSSVDRARRTAEAAGLLTVTRRHDGHRQQSSVWAVQWSRVAILGGPTDQPVSSTDQPVSSAPAACQTDRAARRIDGRPYQIDSLNRGSVSTTVPTSVHGRPSTEDREERAKPAPAGLVPMAAEPVPDPARAYRLARLVGRPQNDRQLSTAWKLAALTPVLGERWLAEIEGALRTVHGIRDRWAYLWTLARDGTHAHAGPGDAVLRRLLRSIDEPAAGWWRAERELTGRLCEAAP